MCGIYGYLRFDSAPAVAEHLAAMGKAITHRGPDDEGQHVDGSCALGMRRLSIIDIYGGQQPISNEDGTIWLVANGEIYNFRELRSRLQSAGHHFKTGSDCEAILHAYEQYDKACVDHLNGMFAFALWDARRKRLVLARDRLGVKPLYLLRSAERVAFASEAKALLELPGVDVELDPTALNCYLNVGYVPAPYSIFKDIEKLPPATILSVEDGHFETRRYWRICGNLHTERSEGDWTEAVRAK
jgi:asparagine synthase (glutamine-hydrolysing)